MKATLRNNPKMKSGGIASWPPIFGESHRTGTPYHTGEQGTLRNVEFLPSHGLRPDRLRVTIEHLGNPLYGTLRVDDVAVLAKLKDLLQTHIGEELSVIGGREIHFD